MTVKTLAIIKDQISQLLLFVELMWFIDTFVPLDLERNGDEIHCQ